MDDPWLIVILGALVIYGGVCTVRVRKELPLMSTYVNFSNKGS